MATNCQRAETEQFMLWCQDAGREGAMKALARNCDRKRGSCVFPKPFLASKPGETMRLFVCGGFGSADGGVGDEIENGQDLVAARGNLGFSIIVEFAWLQPKQEQLWA